MLAVAVGEAVPAVTPYFDSFFPDFTFGVLGNCGCLKNEESTVCQNCSFIIGSVSSGLHQCGRAAGEEASRRLHRLESDVILYQCRTFVFHTFIEGQSPRSW